MSTFADAVPSLIDAKYQVALSEVVTGEKVTCTVFVGNVT
jgi:hypothetical protein